MPKALSGIVEFELSLLRESVAKQFGQAVNSKTDCDKLTDLIEDQTKKYISVNTLRRFFDVMPSASSPSLETLNILSIFCGFADFYAFRQSHIAIGKSSSDLTLDAVNDLQQALGETPRFYTTLNWFLKLAFHENNFNFLKDFFDLQVLRERKDYPRDSLRQLVALFGKELRTRPKLSDALMNHYAVKPAAHALYFEWFVDYDFLALQHHKAIRAYANVKKDNEAQLFSLSLLFLHHFLLLQRNECEQLIKKINAIEITPEMHPFPAGRKFASKILFQSLSKKNIDRSLQRSIEEYESFLPRQGALERNLPSFHLMIAEAFSFVNHHEEVLHYAQLAHKNYPSELNEYSKGVLIPLRLFQANALAQLNKKEEAMEMANAANPMMFDDYSRKYHQMHQYRVLTKTSSGRESLKYKLAANEIAKRHRFLFFAQDF